MTQTQQSAANAATNGIAKSLEGLRKHWLACRGDLLACKNWQGIVAVTALVLVTPWILACTGVVVPAQESSVTRAWMLGVFAAVSMAVILAIACTPLLKRCRSRRFTLLATGFFAGGLLELGLIDGHGLALQLMGAAVLSAGYSMLLVRWVSIPYSRMQNSQVVSVVMLASVLGLAGATVLTVVEFPFGRVLFGVGAAAIGIIVDRLACDDIPRRSDYVASNAAAEPFVMQSGALPKVLLAIGIFFPAFDIVAQMFSSSASSLGESSLGPTSGGALFLGTLVAVAAVLLLAGSRRSPMVMSLLVGMGLVATGSILSCFDALHMAGSLVLVSGAFMFTIFYLLFYNAITKRKDSTVERGVTIFWHTVSLVPGAIAAAAVMYAFLSFAAPDLVGRMGIFGCLAMMFASLALFYTELNATRKELSEKSESTIAVSDIRRYAQTKGGRYSLTDRECDVIHAFMSGRSAKAAASDLCLSESTVKTHARSIYRKMDVHTRQEMIEKVTAELLG